MINEQEWLDANGTGGFSCGTVAGELRRKWHGLLWIATKPPRDRVMVLAGLEVVLVHEEHHVSLTSQWSNGRWNLPSAWPEFETWPMPHWWWELEGGRTLHKRLFTPTGTRSKLMVRYTLEGPGKPDAVSLLIRPILPKASPNLAQGNTLCVQMAAHEKPRIISPTGSLTGVILEIEKDCEDKHTEDFQYGTPIAITVSSEKPTALLFTTLESTQFGETEGLFLAENARRKSLPAPRLRAEYRHLEGALTMAADQFLVTTEEANHLSIMAGYPWFTDWGRDAMIALPGLFLSAGRYEEARSIIRHFLKYLEDGLIPNLFPEKDTAPMYNTVDATLWLVDTTFRCWTNAELQAEPEIIEKLRLIITHHKKGTKNNIHMEPDGLIHAGSPGTQLTWMDVKVNGQVPTPRHGKAIEIQGLWYNALMLMAELHDSLKDQTAATSYRQLARKVCDAVATRYFSDAHEHAADVVDRDGPNSADFSLRPNAVLCFALHHNVIPKERRAGVLQATARELLTPRGLRSLAPKEPGYHGIYRGNVVKRDFAYHQGTVWGWLIGPYLQAITKEKDLVPELAAQAESIRKELVYHFQHEACVNQCSEIFDGNSPHLPRGCYAQAWSVAALITALLEEK